MTNAHSIHVRLRHYVISSVVLLLVLITLFYILRLWLVYSNFSSDINPLVIRRDGPNEVLIAVKDDARLLLAKVNSKELHATAIRSDKCLTLADDTKVSYLNGRFAVKNGVQFFEKDGQYDSRAIHLVKVRVEGGPQNGLVGWTLAINVRRRFPTL